MSERDEQKANLLAKLELVTAELEAATETNAASWNGSSWGNLLDLKSNIECQLDAFENQRRDRH